MPGASPSSISPATPRRTVMPSRATVRAESRSHRNRDQSPWTAQARETPRWRKTLARNGTHLSTSGVVRRSFWAGSGLWLHRRADRRGWVGHAGHRSRPRLPSRALLERSVVDELAVDGVGDLAFQRAANEPSSHPTTPATPTTTTRTRRRPDAATSDEVAE
jgi:hypothetical protein